MIHEIVGTVWQLRFFITLIEKNGKKVIEQISVGQEEQTVQRVSVRSTILSLF